MRYFATADSLCLLHDDNHRYFARMKTSITAKEAEQFFRKTRELHLFDSIEMAKAYAVRQTAQDCHRYSKELFPARHKLFVTPIYVVEIPDEIDINRAGFNTSIMAPYDISDNDSDNWYVQERKALADNIIGLYEIDPSTFMWELNITGHPGKIENISHLSKVYFYHPDFTQAHRTIDFDEQVNEPELRPARQSRCMIV